MADRAEEETQGHPRSEETPSDYRRTPPPETEEHPLDTPGGMSSNWLLWIVLAVAVIVAVLLLFAV